MDSFPTPSVVRHKATGDLLVARRVHAPSRSYAGGVECSPIDNSLSSRHYAADDLEAAPPRARGQKYDLRTDIEPRAQGMIPWEVIEPADFDTTLQNIASCWGWATYDGIAHITLPGAPYTSWARLFLRLTQGGGFTGEAHALVSENGGAYGYPDDLRDAVIAAAQAAVHDKHAPAGDLAAAVLAMEAAKRWRSARPSAWRLAICRHEIKSTGTPDQNMRGWHPAHCVKCGLDLSVDSSD